MGFILFYLYFNIKQILLVYLFIGRATWHTGILVPQPGIERLPPAVEARSPNHWTAREFPRYLLVWKKIKQTWVQILAPITY